MGKMVSALTAANKEGGLRARETGEWGAGDYCHSKQH